jgi:hypothetical protein
MLSHCSLLLIYDTSCSLLKRMQPAAPQLDDVDPFLFAAIVHTLFPTCRREAAGLASTASTPHALGASAYQMASAVLTL